MGTNERINKKMFFKLGGLSNPKLFRKMKNGSWTYWIIFD